ncbi:CoA-binding protein [Enterobacteriaceae bacterium LUAb1]
MDDWQIKNILAETKTIALVGASEKPGRPSYRVMQYLLEQGYNVIPVNPVLKGKILLGQLTYLSLSDIPVRVDMVDVFRHAEAVWEITQEALAIGARTLWLQSGIIHQQAATLAKQAGLNVVMDRCPKIEILRLGMEK